MTDLFGSLMMRAYRKSYSTLTLTRVPTVAQGAETTDKNLNETKAPPEELDSSSSSQAGMKVKSEPIQKVNAKKLNTTKEGAPGGVTCHRCGYPGHLATTCIFKDKVSQVQEARAPG